MGKDLDISNELEKALRDYVEDVDGTLRAAIKEAAKTAKQVVVEKSPVNLGDYKKGWAVRVTQKHGAIDAVVYNKTSPGLTHLLEDSHIIKNKYGEYGRTNPAKNEGGTIHIQPGAEAGEAELLSILNRKL